MSKKVYLLSRGFKLFNENKITESTFNVLYMSLLFLGLAKVHRASLGNELPCPALCFYDLTRRFWRLQGHLKPIPKPSMSKQATLSCLEVDVKRVSGCFPESWRVWGNKK